MRTLPILLALLAACGESEYAGLYDAPSGATTDTIFGTWGGSIQGFDTRWVLATDRITIANKCGDTIVGIDVSAEVSETQIRYLESAQQSEDNCFVKSTPGMTAACSTDEFTPKMNCFVHDKKALTVYETPVSFLALTKLSDETP